MKYFRRSFLSNDFARIPFSVIGVFLILGSSFTTIYVTQLEQENASEISSTLDFNQVDYLVRYVESDLARSLNYAGCKAFQKIGENPVIAAYDGTEYDLDLNGDDDVDYMEVNLNIARHLTMSRFNDYIRTNFMDNCYTVDGYAINVVEKVVDWEDIDVRIIEMNLDRVLNRPFDKPQPTYKVYPVMTTTLFLDVIDVDTQKILLTKKVNVSTIINSRYLLLENMTRDFGKRLSGTTSALGVDVLAGAMGLTWVRGYSQFFLNTPNNIISNEWLEILTNGGILLEEGFVFNSADPIGMVYVGYETADTIANELGYDLGDKLAGLKKSVTNPADGTSFDDAYKENFDDMLPDSEMKDVIDTNISDISTEYTMECDSDNICEEELNNLLKDKSIPDAIKNMYNAIIKILTDRKEISDNLAEILRNLDIEKGNSKTSEESRSSDAKQEVDLPDGWSVTSVNLVSSKFYDQNENAGAWNLKETNLITNTGFFDNSNPNLVVLDGEKWNVIKEKNINYNWNVESTWEIHAENETDSDVFVVVLNSNIYQYDTVRNKVEDVTIKFVSDDYSNGNVDLGNNNIKQPFEIISFYGSETRSDPNLDGALPIYQSVNYINWDDAFRTKIFTDDNGKYVDGSYNNEMLVESEQDSKLHMDWLDIEIIYALEILKEKISTNVTATMLVDQGSMPDDLVDDATDKLLVAYYACRPDWIDEINDKYCKSGIYDSTASKVIYNLSMMYIENVGDRLQMAHEDSVGEILSATDDSISEKDNQDDVGSDYDSIKTDMQHAESLSGITIPIGATLTLRHSGNKYSSWTESVSFAIKQNPPFFNQEYYEEKQYDNYIKYRNLNIFSPMAGADCIVREGFKALNDQILGAIDSGFEELNNIQDATIRQELENNLTSITNSISNELKSSMKSALNGEQGYIISEGDLLSDDEIENMINDVIEPYANDPQNFVEELKNEKIKDDLTSVLKDKADSNIISKYGNDYPFLKDIQNSASETIVHQVTNAYDKAVSNALIEVKTKISDTYESFSKKIEGKVDKKVGATLSKFIPSGLPILPPFGWWCTINAWYIEVEGEIPQFKVVDSRNEALVNPLMGHDSQEYNREFKPVFVDIDGDGFDETEVGKNMPIKFEYNTGTFIIVPPGKTGVGDKTGGMDEIYEHGTKSE